MIFEIEQQAQLEEAQQKLEALADGVNWWIATISTSQTGDHATGVRLRYSHLHGAVFDTTVRAMVDGQWVYMPRSVMEFWYYAMDALYKDGFYVAVDSDGVYLYREADHLEASVTNITDLRCLVLLEALSEVLVMKETPNA